MEKERCENIRSDSDRAYHGNILEVWKAKECHIDKDHSENSKSEKHK